MRAVFLGTGGTYPCKERNVIAIAIQIGRDVLLLDCGEGTQRQFMRSNVSFMNTRWIFISHYHGDHFLGLPGLVQSMNLNDRRKPIEIFGPKGTNEIMSNILTAGHFAPGYEIRTRDISPGDHIRLDGFSVEAVSAEHSVPTLAYAIQEDARPGRFDTAKAASLGIPAGPLFRRLQEGENVSVSGRIVRPDEVLGCPRPGRRIVYSGDTKPCGSVTRLAKNADLLIHDATLMSDAKEQAAAFGHSTAVEAARVALDAGARELALVHISPRYQETEPLEREARSVFGRAFVPQDLHETVLRLRD